jgi:CRP/FNR family nitrogen fixation transcriptional regulator
VITLSTARAKPSLAGLSGKTAGLAASLDMPSHAVTLTSHLQAIQSYGARQHYQRNETIFNQGDPANLDGTVRLCRHQADGRRHIVNFLLPGDMMGFVESPEHPVSAEAVTETSLVAFPYIYFDRLARENAEVRKQLVRYMPPDFLAERQQLMAQGSQKATERVALFLQRLGDRLDVPCGDRIDLAMSRQDIADHLGLTIDAISRALTALRSSGIILVPNSHQLIVRDMVGLRALAAEA